MKITRLDKIIENNISISAQHKPEDQKLFILQDISETLAMIYDRMCGEEPIEQSSESVSVSAYVIPFNNLKDFNELYFEHITFPQGYYTSFIRYEEIKVFDIDPYNNSVERKAIFNVGGSEMKLDEKDYGKKWRCWNVKPTDEERSKVKWEK